MADTALTETLINLLVCPVCHSSLTAGPGNGPYAWLHCTGCSRYYPFEDGIPVMLEGRATLTPPKLEE